MNFFENSPTILQQTSAADRPASSGRLVNLQGRHGRQGSYTEHNKKKKQDQIHWHPTKVYSCPGWNCNGYDHGTQCYSHGKLAYICHDCMNWSGKKVWKHHQTGYTRGDCSPPKSSKMTKKDWEEFGRIWIPPPVRTGIKIANWLR